MFRLLIEQILFESHCKTSVFVFSFAIVAGKDDKEEDEDDVLQTSADLHGKSQQMLQTTTCEVSKPIPTLCSVTQAIHSVSKIYL